MTNTRLNCEYFVLSFIPSVLSDKLLPLGVLLREVETVSGAVRLRFAGAMFSEELKASLGEIQEVDRRVIQEAMAELSAVVERADTSGQGDELDSLLRDLLNTNSGLCAFAYRCGVVSDPATELRTLFHQLIHPHF